MARKGDASTGFLRTAGTFATPTRWSCSFIYQNDSVPDNTTDSILAVGLAGNLRFGFSWGHTSADFRQAFFQQRASSAFDAAKLTSTLLADTSYAIGGRFDGTNLEAFLAGVNEATTGSADPATGSVDKLTVLAAESGVQKDDGEIAEFGLWNTDLTNGEMAALGKRFSPLLVRPQNLIGYWKIIGRQSPEPIVIGTAGALDITGTVVNAVHPRIIYPSAPIIGITTAVANTLVLDKVQTGTIAFGAANTSRNVTITSVDTAKCFILIDWQTDSAGSVATTQHYRARLSSSTNIAIDRTAAVSGDDGLVRWWAVEFSAGITVRHFTGTSRNTNVAIGATVDLAKTFAIISDRPQTFDYDDSQIEGVDIVSTTNFQVKTDNTAESAPNWAVQIIEFDALADPVVEAVTITMSGGTTSNTGSISAITVADSMLIGSGTWSETLGVASQMGFSAALDNTTTVSVTRVTGTGTLIAYMFVIDWGSSIDIRTGVDTLTTAEGVSETQTFSALGSTGDAIAFMRGGSGTFGAQSNHSGSPDDADYAEVSLDSTTQITITRSGTSNDLGPYNWQVIDFAGFAAEDVLMPQVWM